jgi:hypothetical protein
MADDQPGEQTPAAGLASTGLARNSAPAVDPTRAETDPTRAEAEPTRGEPERSTLDAPVRWSGSAAVPPPAPRRGWWPRRLPPAAPSDRAMSSDITDWTATPAVDPWAGQDTPWDPMPIAPADLPPTRMEEALPPTRLDPPPAPPPTPQPPAAQPPTPQPPAAAPPLVPAPAPRRRWGAKRKPQSTQPVNRVPVAPRPAAPAPPPPAWRPPPAAVEKRRPQAQRPPTQRPQPPRCRRRHWGRRFALFTLFTVVCCCGVPIAYFAWPPARQYPVRAVLPASVADLNLRDDGSARRAVARLTQDLTDANAHVDQVFAGVYGDRNGKRVTVFGTTGFRLTPGSDLKSEIDHLTGDYDLRNVKAYDLGEPGAYERCGVGTTNGTSVALCTWADHGSLATVVTTRRSAADTAALTATLRAALLTHKTT